MPGLSTALLLKFRTQNTDTHSSALRAAPVTVKVEFEVYLKIYAQFSST